MSNKFTEEQYQEIIRTYDNNYGYEYKIMAVIRVVDDFNFDNNLSYNEAVAIANPLTREWAQEQFVEKEKQYVWFLKKTVTYNGIKYHRRLFRSLNGDISGVLKQKNEAVFAVEELTEKEVREWGYNPEMFDKEEVD